MTFLLTSCVEEPETPKIEALQSNQISKVKDWFEENKTKLRIPDRGLNFRTESQELILPFFEKEPDWDKFHQYKFPDGREVFEVNLENAIKYFPTSMRDSFPLGNPDEFVIQNIMFVKHPTENRFDPLIVRYFPSSPSSKKSFKDMNYAAIDYDWSGKIELFTYDERHFIGFEVKEGEVTSHYRLKPFEGDKKKSSANHDYTCWQTYHPVGYSVTTTNPDGTKTTHYVIERYVAQTNCSGSSGTNNLEYYVYYGDGTGGSTNPDPDANGTCSSCNYDPPTAPAPTPNLRIQIDNSFSNNPYLNCILGKLQLTKFISDLALFDGTIANGRNVILKVGEVPKRPGQMTAANAETSDELGPYHIQITINQNRVNLGSLELARIILHEMLHAELFVANFHKGGTPIDGDFEANFNMYIEKYYNEGSPGIHHNYMAEQMVDKIGSVLSQIHPYLGKQEFLNDPLVKQGFPKGLPTDFYKGLAWSGLKATDKWRYNLPDRSSYEKYQDIADASLKNECNAN